jgi:hypothetical protein
VIALPGGLQFDGQLRMSDLAAAERATFADGDEDRGHLRTPEQHIPDPRRRAAGRVDRGAGWQID